MGREQGDVKWIVIFANDAYTGYRWTGVVCHPKSIENSLKGTGRIAINVLEKPIMPRDFGWRNYHPIIELKDGISGKSPSMTSTTPGDEFPLHHQNPSCFLC
jgi:hypothetical protein